MENWNVRIMGTGSYLPNAPVPLADIEKVLGKVERAPERIQRWLENNVAVMKELLEVKYYHYAMDPVTREYTDDNITMSVKAARIALESSGMAAGDIDLLVYGAPYMHFMPCGSVRIQEALGIENCAEFSVHANCTSSYKALAMAETFLKMGRYRNALIVSSHMASAQLRAESLNQERLSKEDLFLRWFLCDGAGAMVLQAVKDAPRGFFVESTYLESVGTHKPSAMHTDWPTYFLNPKIVYENAMHHMKQMFQKELSRYFHEEDGSVFLNGVKRMLDRYPVALDRLRYFQINMPSKHVVDLLADELASIGIRNECLYSPIGEMGYTGPPASFISLDALLRDKAALFLDGDIVMSFVTEVSKFMQAGYVLKFNT